jgi:uncharacterized zinc-type alcohol dehydrogenase-like protein
VGIAAAIATAAVFATGPATAGDRAIIDTTRSPHATMQMVDLDGVFVELGAPENPLVVPPFSIIGMRRSIAGSVIGGIPETQEMLDFCAEHGIASEVEVIAPDYVNEAYERVVASDVRYRFVIDCESLRHA